MKRSGLVECLRGDEAENKKRDPPVKHMDKPVPPLAERGVYAKIIRIYEVIFFA